MKPLTYTHVYVIESLKPGESKTGTMLYNDIIKRQMERNGKGNNCELIEVQSKTELVRALYKISTIAITDLANPVIHLEMHGHVDGIQLASGEMVTWAFLQVLLVQINGICGNNLLITMATCKGAYLFNTMQPDFRSPMWGFVGPFIDVNAQEILDSYTAFYEIFLTQNTYSKPEDFKDAIDALNRANATSASNFHFYKTEEIMFKTYENYRTYHLTPERIKERAEEILMDLKSHPEFSNYSDAEIKSLAAIIMLKEDKNLHKDFVHRFFMIDKFPEHAQYYDALK